MIIRTIFTQNGKREKSSELGLKNSKLELRENCPFMSGRRKYTVTI
jgi:hypothetical protein